MGLLGSLRGKQGGDVIRQSTTTATMHLLEQNHKFEVFMREKVATLERQVAEDDGRLNRSDGGEEGDGLPGETDLATDLGANGPDEGQATGAGLPAGAGYEEVAVIGEDSGGPDEELELPVVPPPARPTVPVSPPPPPAPSPKAASAPPDWRAYLAGASTTPAPGAPAARVAEPLAGEGDQVGAQGEDVAEEEAPAEVEASEPAAGEGDQVDAQGEEEEEDGGGDLFAMNLPIISAASAVPGREQPPAPSVTVVSSAAVPSAPPAAAKASSPAPAGEATAQKTDEGWDQGGLQDGQVGRWA